MAVFKRRNSCVDWYAVQEQSDLFPGNNRRPQSVNRLLYNVYRQIINMQNPLSIILALVPRRGFGALKGS